MRVTVFLVLGTAVVLAQQPAKLLPTDREAATVRVLQTRLNDVGEAEGRPENYVRLKNLVRDFIIQQLEASPGIRDEDLVSQLTHILGKNESEEAPPPYFAFSGTGFGPNSEARLWAVAYPVSFGFHGVGATGIVIDSYVWEKGKARLAGRGGGELSGHWLNVRTVERSPDGLLILADGMLTGSSGSAISGRAVLYRVDAAGVHTVWQTALLPGLHAFAGEGLFTLEYADRARWYASPRLPNARIVEVWQIYGSNPPRLLVRNHY